MCKISETRDNLLYSYLCANILKRNRTNSLYSYLCASFQKPEITYCIHIYVQAFWNETELTHCIHIYVQASWNQTEITHCIHIYLYDPFSKPNSANGLMFAHTKSKPTIMLCISVLFYCVIHWIKKYMITMCLLLERKCGLFVWMNWNLCKHSTWKRDAGTDV